MQNKPPQNKVVPNTENASINWTNFKAIEKRHINWFQIPFSQPLLFLEPTEQPVYPEKIPTSIDYFFKYLPTFLKMILSILQSLQIYMQNKNLQQHLKNVLLQKLKF